MTIAWSIPIYFLLPASPLQPGRFFSTRDKEILIRRFQQNPFGKDRQPFNLPQFIEAVTDWKSYIYLLMATAIYVSAPIRRHVGNRYPVLTLRSVMEL